MAYHCYMDMKREWPALWKPRNFKVISRSSGVTYKRSSGLPLLRMDMNNLSGVESSSDANYLKVSSRSPWQMGYHCYMDMAIVGWSHMSR